VPNSASENTITIDFETYYSRQFSLSIMTTAEYVLSSFFETIGVAVKVNDEATQSFTGTHGETKAWLNQYDWENSTMVAHNCLFDAAILVWRFDIHPKAFMCTMMGARPDIVPFTKNNRMSLAMVAEYLGLGAKGTEVLNALGKRRSDFTPEEMGRYMAYCRQDTELCHGIVEVIKGQLPASEMVAIDLTIRKYTYPRLMLDRDILIARLKQVKADKARLLQKAELQDKAVLMSNPKFAVMLENLGISPPMKTSPATGKPTFAFAKTDTAFKDLLDHEDIRVQVLVAARMGLKSTIEETRLARFIKLADLGTPFAVPILYWAALTGRFGGLDKLNLQNLPRGGALRQAIVAPPGYKMLAADWSQIEPRIVAMLAGCTELIQAFRDGRDVYSEFGTKKLFKRHVGKDTPEDRHLSKCVILGCGYGMGPVKFKDTVKIQGIELTQKEATKAVYAYRDGYPEIPDLWHLCDEAIQAMSDGRMMAIGPVVTAKHMLIMPNGTRLHYPDLRYDPLDRGWIYGHGRNQRKLYGAKMLENITQALARIILVDLEARLAPKLRATMTMHDEGVFCVKEHVVDKVVRILNLAMAVPPTWMPDIPLACEINCGDNFAECK
jgi:DNA polymerase